MKGIRLAAVMATAFLVPSFALVGNAGAANPHGTPPGHGGDPNASCGGGSGGKPESCNSPNLPFSEGCQHGQAPSQNPHCEPAGTSTPPGGNPGGNPGGSPGGQGVSAPASGGPAGGVAGAEEEGGPGNKLAARNAQGKGGKLPFTGIETVWLALLGAAMLTAGLALGARSGGSKWRRALRIPTGIGSY